MFPAAMLALSMLTALGLLAVAPPPRMSAQDRAQVASGAMMHAQLRALDHCRLHACAAGEVGLPAAAGAMSANVAVYRQADGALVATWRGAPGTLWSETVLGEALNVELERAARRARLTGAAGGAAAAVGVGGVGGLVADDDAHRRPVLVVRGGGE